MLSTGSSAQRSSASRASSAIASELPSPKRPRQAQSASGTRKTRATISEWVTDWTGPGSSWTVPLMPPGKCRTVSPATGYQALQIVASRPPEAAFPWVLKKAEGAAISAGSESAATQAGTDRPAADTRPRCRQRHQDGEDRQHRPLLGGDREAEQDAGDDAALLGGRHHRADRERRGEDLLRVAHPQRFPAQRVDHAEQRQHELAEGRGAAPPGDRRQVPAQRGGAQQAAERRPLVAAQPAVAEEPERCLHDRRERPHDRRRLQPGGEVAVGQRRHRRRRVAAPIAQGRVREGQPETGTDEEPGQEQVSRRTTHTRVSTPARAELSCERRALDGINHLCPARRHRHPLLARGEQVAVDLRQPGQVVDVLVHVGDADHA